jgi:hypothetical protein
MAKVFDRKTRRSVCEASADLPSLSVWIDRIEAIGDDNLAEAVGGIWCGREGQEVIEISGAACCLCVGWYNGKAEWSYIS